MLTRFRRLSQIVFFSAFVLLLLRTEFRGSVRAAGSDVRVSPAVRWFLEIDPLNAISNALATRALYRGLLWSLIIILPTLFLGRFFCGWICPLGAINHFFSSWKSESKRGKQLIESNRYQRWQAWKYYILIAGLVAAVFGSQVIGIMDPISFTIRSLTTSILPAVNYAANAAFDAMDRSGWGPLQIASMVLSFIGQLTVVTFRQPHFRQAFVLGLIFVAFIALNLKVTRFWCRALCPLGALLGTISRWSILGLEKNAAKCDACNRCLLHCQGADDPIPGAKWRKAECHLCLNCVAECEQGAVQFKFFPKTAETIDVPSLSRRKALAGVAAGVALVPMLRASTGLKAEHDERVIRPAGSLTEEQFLARCIRCGECMKVCPNNALQPTYTQAGLEGIWTPVIVPRIGYCEPSCVLCGQVCPTGAIWQISQQEKGWVGADTKPIRIGTAFYDRGRCLPWAMGTECIVCEEWCPTSPKAIFLREAQAFDRAGNVKTVRQPYVDAEKCVGCGACEFACPVQDRPAVYVTAIGESRSKSNQILLRRAKGQS
jgi:polyferredoxin/Pyruvate/2-oxoacid:ferredoxin oxidoreductase delta subunit